jgi:hypothetical protein
VVVPLDSVEFNAGNAFDHLTECTSELSNIMIAKNKNGQFNQKDPCMGFH